MICLRREEWQIKNVPASPVGFSNVIPISAESHLQWLQYKKNGGSPTALNVADIRPSGVSVGSEDTTDRVLWQIGHEKQLRAHLSKRLSTFYVQHRPSRLTYSSLHERLRLGPQTGNLDSSTC